MTKKVTVIVEGREYIVEVGDLGTSPVTATVNAKSYKVEVPEKQTTTRATAPPVSGQQPMAAPAPTPVKAAQDPCGKMITAPMPGDILEIRVQPGDAVNPGDVICVLEAMKMKNMIKSANSGKIASVMVSPGQAVEYNAPLVTFE